MPWTRFAHAGAIALAVYALFGCGGSAGDSSSAVTTPPPASPPTTANAASAAPLAGAYLLNVQGAIDTLPFTIDEAGNVSNLGGGIAYQLERGGGSACSFNSNPTDPTVAACNLLADGKGVLLCPGTQTTNYTATLFRQSDVQLATHFELAGKTLSGIACGSGGPQATGYSFVFSSDAQTATEYAATTTTYDAGMPGRMELTTYCPPNTSCQRLLMYKTTNGTQTQYFLLVLRQDAFGLTPRPANLYFLQT